MKKLILLFFIACSLSANYKIIENENLFSVKVEDESFQEVLVNLKDEISFQGFVIVHELNLAKSTSNVAKALKQNPVLTNGINLLMCKSSFTLKMIQETSSNITYCPLGISVYELKNEVFISYKKYHNLKDEDMIYKEVNEKLKNLILKSLD
ncbi:hypothetical protein [Arcobacter sp. YIC-80]|uniref:hypothetical protein n=1 Tax=unclassified Arcobacter TaxID=2593671 RepID=UPI00384F1C22